MNAYGNYRCSMFKIRSKRINSRKIYKNDIVYLPEEIIDNLTCRLSLSEMELNCNLGDDEWQIIEQIKLSKREKQCLYMYYWECMKQKQISENLNIRQRVVSTYLTRAKIKIQKHFRK